MAMVQSIPPPNPRELLPPFLACLPTAFASPRPPPALLPLLTPILQQRVQLLSSTTTSDSWLPLLCWDPASAERLSSIVDSDTFELHPVSGEVEFKDIEDISYRRLDEETLQTRIKATDLDLAIIYLWCEGNSEGGINGWRVSELHPSDMNVDAVNHPWWRSIELANEKGNDTSITNLAGEVPPTSNSTQEEEDGDEDEYWSQYDNPAQSVSTQPIENHDTEGENPLAVASDAEYYAQYSQVQPAMDHEDPEEDQRVTGTSTLNGNAISDAGFRDVPNGVIGHNISQPIEIGRQQLDESSIIISHPRPSSSSSKESVAIERLEDSAAAQSLGEIAVQQYISTSINSLFRLARGVGIEGAEFSRIIRTELQSLSIMDDDDRDSR